MPTAAVNNPTNRCSAVKTAHCIKPIAAYIEPLPVTLPRMGALAISFSLNFAEKGRLVSNKKAHVPTANEEIEMAISTQENR
mmetsp:Transcript_6304/g.15684  ORF Transcript_6304/g.15684 Transcript_6304/m.15684 type:complete len:82 (-) Transcript_6304:356-601(-)